MKQIFQDKDGNLSSKRVAGAVLLVCAIVFNALKLGDPNTNIQMLYAGGICLGITAFEKKAAI